MTLLVLKVTRQASQNTSIASLLAPTLPTSSVVVDATVHVHDTGKAVILCRYVKV